MSRAVGLCADGVSSRVTHPAALPVEEPNVHTGRRVKGEGRQAVTAVPREKDFELCSRGFRAFSRFFGLLHEYMGHDVSNMRGFDSYRLLTLSLAALMTRISSVVIEGAHTSAGAATLARTVPFWGRFRSPREPTAGPCRGCLLPSATNTAPSRHHLQAVLCDGWDVQTPPSWLLRPQTRELYGWS